LVTQGSSDPLAQGAAVRNMPALLAIAVLMRASIGPISTPS